MIPIIQSIDSLTAPNSPLATDLLPVSYPLQVCFRVYHIAYSYLRCIIGFRKYGSLAAGGVLLNFVDNPNGRRSWIDIAAQIELIFLASLECLESIRKVATAFEKLQVATSGALPVPTAIVQEKANMDAETSKERVRTFSLLAQLPEPVFHTILRIEAVTKAALTLAWELMCLSASLFRLFEAYVYDRITQFEARAGFFTHGIEIYKKLTSDPDALARRIESHPDFINKIFSFIGSKCTAGDLAGYVRGAITTIQTGAQVTKDVAVGVKDTSQDGLFNASYLVSGAFTSHLAPEENKSSAPLFQVKEFDDNKASAHSACSVPREWNLNEQYYTPIKC